MKAGNVITSLIVIGLIAPCVVFGKGKKGPKIIEARHAPPAKTWTIQSIETVTPAEGSRTTNAVNFVTLKSSAGEVKKFKVPAIARVNLDGSSGKFTDLKEGMNVKKFTVAVSGSVLSSIDARTVADKSADGNAEAAPQPAAPQ